jgi:hypothetical protein
MTLWIQLSDVGRILACRQHALRVELGRDQRRAVRCPVVSQLSLLTCYCGAQDASLLIRNLALSSSPIPHVLLA